MKLTFNIPDNKLEKITEAVIARYPIPLDNDRKQKFTPDEWVKEVVKKFILDIYNDNEREKAMSSINLEFQQKMKDVYTPDNNLVT